MAKSIRSKIKRKHRAEFRATIGNVSHGLCVFSQARTNVIVLTFFGNMFQAAYQATMVKVNENLKQSIEQQSMSDETFEKLSNLLGSTVDDSGMDVPEEMPAIDAAETSKPSAPIRGENQVRSRLTPSKRSKRRKHKVDTSCVKIDGEAKEKRKPRFFCQF